MTLFPLALPAILLTVAAAIPMPLVALPLGLVAAVIAVAIALLKALAPSNPVLHRAPTIRTTAGHGRNGPMKPRVG